VPRRWEKGFQGSDAPLGGIGKGREPLPQGCRDSMSLPMAGQGTQFLGGDYKGGTSLWGGCNRPVKAGWHEGPDLEAPLRVNVTK
jgi:hypothetical protein